MAVQAPHYLFSSPHLPSSSKAHSNLLDDLQMLHNHPFHVHGSAAPVAGPASGAMASGTQQSGLTTDASASRKKRRIDEQPPITAGIASVEVSPATESRLLASVGASTSGRPSVAGDVTSLFSQHNVEIDALVRLQSERLRKLVEEAAKKQQRLLLAAAEENIAKRLRAKEAEVAAAAKKNVELEARVRQASGESQFWFAAARNSEALACSLRNTLEQTLQQGMQAKCYKARAGSSNSDCYVVEADDAESCCFDSEDLQQERVAGNDRVCSCRSCGKNEVCVLLLPCRHLCLCKDCEPRQEVCPVCNAAKNASLRVFMA